MCKTGLIGVCGKEGVDKKKKEKLEETGRAELKSREAEINGILK